MDLPEYRAAAQATGELFRAGDGSGACYKPKLEKQRKALQGMRRLQAAEKVRVDLRLSSPKER